MVIAVAAMLAAGMQVVWRREKKTAVDNIWNEVVVQTSRILVKAAKNLAEIQPGAQ